jgi:hypothetical protein
MSDEDVSTTRGLKMPKYRYTLIVCAKATGNQKIPVGKTVTPAFFHVKTGPILILQREIHGWM